MCPSYSLVMCFILGISRDDFGVTFLEHPEFRRASTVQLYLVRALGFSMFASQNLSNKTIILEVMVLQE